MKRIQTLTIAAAIALITGIAALTAYLVDNDVFNDTFTTPDHFEVTISTDDVNHVIAYGETVTLNPTITNNSDVDAYVFAEVNVPGFEYVINDGWEEVETGVYFHSEALIPGEVATVMDSITLEAVDSPETEAVAESLPITITAYGIQSAGYEEATAAQIWADAKSDIVNIGWQFFLKHTGTYAASVVVA